MGAISFFRGSLHPRDWTCVCCIGRQVLYHWETTWEAFLRDSPNEWPANLYIKDDSGTPLVVQWLRLCLAMHRVWVRYLVGELRFHMPHSIKRLSKSESEVVSDSLQSLALLCTIRQSVLIYEVLWSNSQNMVVFQTQHVVSTSLPACSLLTGLVSGVWMPSYPSVRSSLSRTDGTPSKLTSSHSYFLGF